MEISKTDLDSFVDDIANFESLSLEDQIFVFCYFLQEKLEFTTFTAKDLEQCFQLLDLTLPTNINSRLSQFEKKKPKKLLVKINGGYRVERLKLKNIETEILGKPKLKEISNSLEKLPSDLQEPESNYVKEVIDCLKIEAYHASVVLMWVVTISHLRNYVLAFKLKEFNSSLASHPKYRKKGLVISKYEDFEEIKETDFLQILKTMGSLSKTRHKLLEEKLGIRNTYAHPSSLTLTETKTISFIEDLIIDIITKIKY